MGWVNLAMVKILMLIFGITKIQALLLVFRNHALDCNDLNPFRDSGAFWLRTFSVCPQNGMMIVLAWFAVDAVGGMGSADG